jgi:hypothetical protein
VQCSATSDASIKIALRALTYYSRLYWQWYLWTKQIHLTSTLPNLVDCPCADYPAYQRVCRYTHSLSCTSPSAHRRFSLQPLARRPFAPEGGCYLRHHALQLFTVSEHLRRPEIHSFPQLQTALPFDLDPSSRVDRRFCSTKHNIFPESP